jgi:hypothetical protein
MLETGAPGAQVSYKPVVPLTCPSTAAAVLGRQLPLLTRCSASMSCIMPSKHDGQIVWVASAPCAAGLITLAHQPQTTCSAFSIPGFIAIRVPRKKGGNRLGFGAIAPRAVTVGRQS